MLFDLIINYAPILAAFVAIIVTARYNCKAAKRRRERDNYYSKLNNPTNKSRRR